MTDRVPIYRESGQTFEADTCAVVRRAMDSGKIRMKALRRAQYPGELLPRGILPGLCSVGFWDAETAQDWGLPWHRNEGLEITLLDSGSTSFSVDGRDFPLRPGDLAVTRPWQPHRLGDPNIGPSRLFWCILDVGMRRPHQSWRWPSWLVMTPADRQLMTQMLRQNEQPVWHASPEVRRCFRQLGEIVDAEGATERLSLLAVHLNELFVLLFRMFRQGDVPLDESLTSPLRTVEMFWRELESQPALLVREWTLPQMARSCRLGLTRFVEYSRQINNASPMHHLSRLRIELACRVLVERPERSITEVALDCGFASSQYFSKVFRQQKKCTPGVFRSVSAPSH